MQTRTITVDYARPRGYDVGYRAENNFTLLALPVPEELENADSYRVYFESTVGDYLQTETLTPVDGYVTVKITSDVVPEPGNMAAQLVAFADGEIVGYAPMITGSAKVSIPDGTERLSHSLAAEIALNTAARHSHTNKSVLDKFAEIDGKPTYDGQALGGGGGTSDFIIKMTVEGNDDGNYTVTSCDATVEQIDAAVAAEKRVVLVASFYGTILELPMLQEAQGVMYSFGMFMNGQMITSFVQKIDGGTSEWQFLMTQIEAVSVSYSNDALPNVDNVGGALNALVPKSHTHANKAVLDKLSVLNGKLQYNGSDVGLKGDKGDPGSDANVTKDNVVAALGYTPEAVSAQVTTGSNITLADNTEYRLTDVTTLTLTYPTGKFECWMRLTFAASGNITVTLPADTEYLGATPNFKNGETWELSFKDKVLAAKKVGDDDKDAGGENGVTPHIGENGNWYIGNTDTGKPSRGESGKSAYQYAQDGGYTGTETEFAEKLASGALIVHVTDNNGTLSADKTFIEIENTIIAGIPVLVDYNGMRLPLIAILESSMLFGAIQCANDDYGAMVGTYIVEITQNGEVNDISTFVETLPNPNAITFTGAVTGSYDGSSPMSVNIPSAVTDDHINSLIDTKLGVIENGSY